MSKEKYNQKLISRLKKGDVFAFDEIYGKYNKKIYSISFSYLKSKEDAEGIVQEVFLNIWRKRADLIDQYKFDSYLFTITYNMIRKYFCRLTKQRKVQEDYGKTISLDDDSTNAEIEYNNLLDLAETAINRLPVRQRTVYLLKMRKGLTNEEISRKLRISGRTVENHLHRAKGSLKKTILDDRLISLLFIWLYIQ